MRTEKWKTYVFSDFVEINPSVKLNGGGLFSFVEMKDLNEGQRSVYPSAEREVSGGARFQNDDTLFARITPCLENGKICQVKGLKNGIGFGSTEFLVFRGKDGVSDNDFVFYLSRFEEVRRFAEQNMIGTSGRQRVGREAFDNLILDLPPLSTQRRIASILTALDDKIELNRRMNETLEGIAQAVWGEWFGKYAREDEELPEGWSIGKLGDVAQTKKGQIKPDEMTDDLQYVGLEHITRKSLSLTDSGTAGKLESNKFRFSKGDLLFGKLRPYFHKVCVAPFDGVCSTDILVIKPKTPEWHAFVVFHFYSDELIAFTTATADGTRMPRTSWNDLAGYEIAIPPKELALAFNKFARPIFEMMIENILQSRTLTVLRDALLPRLMRGELQI